MHYVTLILFSKKICGINDLWKARWIILYSTDEYFSIQSLHFLTFKVVVQKKVIQIIILLIYFLFCPTVGASECWLQRTLICNNTRA